jgi:hypothetical protein
LENQIKKIVLIGPESSGKTTLCEQLSNHYGSLWVQEYARVYFQINGKKYKFDDIRKIGEGQLKNEETGIEKALELIYNNPEKKQPLFLDTDFHVLKVWSEWIFNKCDNWILKTISERSYDLYLLCAPDIPWIKDELREAPDLELRLKLFEHYKEIMIKQHTPWKIINGDFETRLMQSIKAVEELFQ